MREDVVGDEERARLDLAPRKLEQALVVLLLCVDEDDVEDVVDRGQRLERVALDELGPVVPPRRGDVSAPRLTLGRIGLERGNPAAEIADPRGQPDGRVAARAADLEHPAAGRRRDEGEEESTRRGLDRARAELPRDTLVALAAILLLELR